MAADTPYKPAELVRDAVRAVQLRQRQRTAGKRKLPLFLVIGGQRCGTTSLYNYLIRHPQVAAPLAKEIQYFTLNFDRGLSWYRAHFPLRSDPGSSFEASPYYLFHPSAPARAAGLLPDARLVALLRNPVDRAWSHYRHNLRLGTESLPFAEAIAAEPARLEEERLALHGPGPAHRRYSYTQRGLYAGQLERWFDHFGRERLLVVLSEDFFADPSHWFRSILEFVGLEPFDLGDYEVFTRSDRMAQEEPGAEDRDVLTRYFSQPNRELEQLLGRRTGWS